MVKSAPLIREAAMFEINPVLNKITDMQARIAVLRGRL